MIAVNRKSSLIFVKSSKNLTYVVNVLKGIPSLGILPSNHYEVHGMIAGNLFKVTSSLSLRHAYITFKNLQSLADFPEQGSASGIVEVVNVSIEKTHLVLECIAIILEEDHLN